MFKIVFVIATLTQAGPVQGDMPDQARFKTEAECKTFGDHMAPRAADWVRGRMGVEWSHPVAVQYRCEIDGNPA